MIIETIEGDLLDFPRGVNTIVHSCNTANTMGAGIAKQIRNKYPEVFEADRQANLSGENRLGYFSFCKLNSNPNKRVINLYTQENVGEGRQVDYEGFYKSIDYLFRAINTAPRVEEYTLGFPFGISCGLAGGAWNIIHAMINEVFMPAKFKTYIVKQEEEYSV